MTVYRGQRIGGEQVAFIRQLIAEHPELSRWKLSRQLCEAWQWRQANGALRDMVCRGLLLLLHRAGEMELPPVRRTRKSRCSTAGWSSITIWAMSSRWVLQHSAAPHQLLENIDCCSSQD
jgi:hypothetical protein